MYVSDIMFFKKSCFSTFFLAVGCLFFVSSSLSLTCFGAEVEKTFPFLIVIDPFSHQLQKVSCENIFSILDLHVLADEGPLSPEEWNTTPEPKENDYVPWSSVEDIWTTESKSLTEGFSFADPASQTWFDRLMQNAKKFKD